MPSDETPVSAGSTSTPEPTTTTPARRTRRRAASRPAGPPQPTTSASSEPVQVSSEPVAAVQATAVAPETPTKKASSRRTRKAAAVPVSGETGPTEATSVTPDDAPVKTTARKRSRKSVADPFAATVGEAEAQPGSVGEPRPAPNDADRTESAFSPVFQAPDPAAGSTAQPVDSADGRDQPSTGEATDSAGTTSNRRRRSRGGRNRRKSSDPATESPTADSGAADAGHVQAESGEPDVDASGAADDEQPASAKKSTSKAESAKKASAKKSSSKKSKSAEASKEASGQPADGDSDDGDRPKDGDATAPTSSSSRRRRRRRRSGDGPADGSGDSPETVVKVREPRPASDSITSVEGSTRIEAKKQRRREGREAGRRRAPILSESEFLARRESVDRVMVVRQREDVTQIAVLEDNVLVEHYVALETQSSLIGNVYLGRVQNVLPSMEAAFIDIGKGRNAVLYAGEVNWDLIGDRNQPRRIENALKSGQQILVQVSKDPVGHKGARLTSQISLPGRYLVYVPGGGSSGISRKLADTERSRLKNLLKEILPDESGVIIRTAAEGASEEELTRDVTRLTSRWAEIEKKAKSGKAPALLYAEPDVTLKVVRDLFTEDFAKLVVFGDEAWETVHDYVEYVAPDLLERLERYEGKDVFANYRVDEQIAKALERKVWLPSGGSLVIDRTEAMTVVDVNTGKFTGSGGNLEQTVTKNNLEAAEEIVRQLRLRDIGGIIVIDFIDMVLENNRDLVLRRLVECLGRDRTRHQVAEVTSLGLVQMTRKRIGTGLVEAFSVPCEHCHGRGVIIESEPVTGKGEEPAAPSGRTTAKRSGRSRSAAKADVEPETDPGAVERHNAAAAATAAIAAALHLDQRQPTDTESEPTGGEAPDVALADGEPLDVGLAEAPAGVESLGSTSDDPVAAAKPATSRRSAAAKKTVKKTASKTAASKTATSKTTTSKTAAKKATSKRASTKKAPAKKAPAKKAPADPDAARQAVLQAAGMSS